MTGRAELPPPSPRLLAAFHRYVRFYVPRHFHAVRLARDSAAFPDSGPLAVYCNHPAWWDPLVGLLLALDGLPRRRHYAPIDSRALERYRFFARLGFFGVEPGSTRGARQFLRAADSLACNDDAVLWITAQGEFTDPRSRPVRLQPGLAHLPRRWRRGWLVPLALEYPFWQERLPEALLQVGEPLPVAGVLDHPPAELTADLARRLEATQDTLAGHAMSQDPARFETLLAGAAGMANVYGLWQRLRARLRGERHHPEHAAIRHREGGR